MKLRLSLETLGDLDGGSARVLINRELQRAVDDLYDRGHEDGKPRKVNITVELLHKDKLITVKALAQAKLPPMASGTTSADVTLIGPKKTPVVGFQSVASDNPAQPTFPQFEEPEEDKE